MSSIDINQLLGQLRSLAAQAQGLEARPAPPSAEGTGANFPALLKQSIDSVNARQQTAAALRTSFELGDRETRLTDVMLAGAKAELAFQGMVQVRNRVVEAYQEIMRMQV